jgi:hypothetical protein
VVAYVAVVAIGMIAAAVVLWIAARRLHVRTPGFIAAAAVTGVLGFPLTFGLDRANLETIVALVLGAGLIFFAADRDYAAAIFLGLATAIKPFPALFFLLLVRARKFREAAVGVGVAGVTVLLALTALGPTPIAAYKGLQAGIGYYVGHQIMAFPLRYEGRFEHSIMDCMKSLALEAKYTSVHGAASLFHLTPAETVLPEGQLQAMPQFPNIHLIYIVSMVLTVLTLAFILYRVFKLPTVNQMILLAIAITLLPPIAAEYTLMHLYVPFALFLIFLGRDVATGKVFFRQRYVVALLLIFAALFAPLSFLHRFAGDAKTFLLVALLGLVGTIPMPSSLFREV